MLESILILGEIKVVVFLFKPFNAPMGSINYVPDLYCEDSVINRLVLTWRLVAKISL